MAVRDPARRELQDLFRHQLGDDPDGEAQDEVMEFDEEDSEFEELPDGSTVFTLGGSDKKKSVLETEFFTNLLADDSGVDIDPTYLSTLATDLLESIDLDIQAREPRDKQYEEGLKRTGMSNDAPGGAAFSGASKVTHPILSSAAVDYEARVIKEIMPPGGPVKDFIPGTATKERVEKAKRKVRHLNWQLTKQIPEFRSGLEVILTQEPIAGVAYQRWHFDMRLKRPSAVFVPVDRMVIPAAATDFYTAERRTLIDDITELTFKERVSDGIYIDTPNMVGVGSQTPEKSKSEEVSDVIEGKIPDDWMNKDGLRRVFETEMMLDLSKWDDKANDEPRPYIVRICKVSQKVLGIVRNWHPQKNEREALMWTIEWPFVPWRGAVPVGLIHLMGGIPGALTGALRALLDSAHVNNIPTAVKLKGSKQGGQTIQLNACELTELDGGIAADDIRKIVMALPFNEPSPVLYQLLGFLTSEGRGVVRTTMEDLPEQKADMPVGTTLALIEQGMAVMAAVHARQYVAMAASLSILCRINAMYQDDEELKDEVGEVLARASDYQGPEDVIPVADPRIFSEAQRFAQAQVVVSRADGPKSFLYNARKVELMLLERLKIPNPEQLLVAPPEPKELNAVNENVAATLGRPITAFPEQDHLAHIQAHLDYMTSPMFGFMAMIAPKFLPLMMQHIVEHLTLWYANRVFELASASTDRDFSEYLEFRDAETRQEIDRVLAIAGSMAIEEATATFSKLPPIIEKTMQMMQQYAQNAMPQDPQGQTKMAVAQIQTQARSQDKAQEIRVRMEELKLRAITGGQANQTRVQTAQLQAATQTQNTQTQVAADAARQQTEVAARARQEAFSQSAETERAAVNNESRERMNLEDNQTALTIAQAEIESGERVAVSTGTDSSPGD